MTEPTVLTAFITTYAVIGLYVVSLILRDRRGAE